MGSDPLRSYDGRGGNGTPDWKNDPKESPSLRRMKERYDPAMGGDGTLSDKERERLGFARWLYRSGKLES